MSEVGRVPKVRYFTHPRELPQEGNVLVYGAGGRGTFLLRSIRAHGSGLKAVGFLDSFKPGRMAGLPVHAASELPDLLRAHGADRTIIVVASYYHKAIGEELARRGVTDYHVLLEECEILPYLNLPEEEVLRMLNAKRHPLNSPPKDTKARDGRRFRCMSLTALYLRPTGFSLCCWMPDLVHATDPALALSRLDGIRRLLIGGIDRGECPFCASCPELVPTAGPADTDKITLLHMDTSTTCNLACSYCNVKDSMPRCEYDPEAVLGLLREEGRLAPGYQFDWGGFGEPSINPHFGQITGRMLEEGASGLVYTNALVRSPVIERGLAAGKLTIVCSVDAGTRETYRAVRNVDAFEAVWKNIATYVRLNPELVMIKYIVTPDNAGREETDAFAGRCAGAGVRHVTIAKDFFSRRTPAPVREGVRNLAQECARRGLKYLFLPTAMSPAFVRSLKLGKPSPE